MGTTQPIEPPARRTGGRSARVRAAVLAATRETLLDSGVEGLSIPEVARRSGVHQTSIYRRWGDRSNLALDAVLDHIDTHVAMPDTGSLRGDLLALLREIAAFMQTPLGRILISVAERLDLPEYESARGAFWTARVASAAQVFDRAERRGELREGVDRQTAMALLVGPLSLRLTLTRQPLSEDFLTAVVDLLLDGLAATASRPARP